MKRRDWALLALGACFLGVAAWYTLSNPTLNVEFKALFLSYEGPILGLCPVLLVVAGIAWLPKQLMAVFRNSKK
jgi:hypothetical protein